MIGKGIFKFEIDGGTVGFKFGMTACGITEEVAGCQISEVFKKITNEKGGAINSLLDYFYGGAVAYAQREKKDPPTREEVSDWIDEIGFEKAVEMFHNSIMGPMDPNQKAPQAKEEGPKSSE